MAMINITKVADGDQGRPVLVRLEHGCFEGVLLGKSGDSLLVDVGGYAEDQRTVDGQDAWFIDEGAMLESLLDRLEQFFNQLLLDNKKLNQASFRDESGIVLSGNEVSFLLAALRRPGSTFHKLHGAVRVALGEAEKRLEELGETVTIEVNAPVALMQVELTGKIVAHKSTLCFMDVLAAQYKMQTSDNVAALQAENERLRAALAMSDRPCLYCSLPVEEWATCKKGFPGCDRADDSLGCPHLGASLRPPTAGGVQWYDLNDRDAMNKFDPHTEARLLCLLPGMEYLDTILWNPQDYDAEINLDFFIQKLRTWRYSGFFLIEDMLKVAQGKGQECSREDGGSAKDDLF